VAWLTKPPGTTGLGAGAVSYIAANSPARIFFSGRNAANAQELVEQVKASAPGVKLSFIECDLTSLASVRAAANNILSQAERLDVLMCNAGVMALPPGVSKDGYEIQFATNHLGHALLIKLLLPLMLKTAEQPNSDVRIVNLTSEAYNIAPKGGIDFATLASDQATLGTLLMPERWMRYGQSKLANLLYARALAHHHPSITSVSVHPGFIKTGLVDGLSFMDRVLVQMASKGNWTPLDHGSYNQTWAATVPKSCLTNGAFYMPVGIKPDKLAVPQAEDEVLAEKLWAWTETELAKWI
jgi:NAD(P)-dependent dehydrogenase (short-subunit alcohol dehydrogenase family)